MTDLNPKMMQKEITIELGEGDTQESVRAQLDQAMKEDIFIKISDAGFIHRFFQKQLLNLIKVFNHALMRTSPQTRRWFWFHRYQKQHLLHKALAVFRWLFRKTLIDDIEKIPKKPWNNLIRIWRYNCHESIIDIWRVWHTKQQLNNHMKTTQEKIDITNQDCKKFLTDNDYVCYTARKTYLDFETTMVMMDTADRARIEIEMLRNCHSMMKMYGVSPTERAKVPRYENYPLFLAGIGKDPEYFIKFRNVGVWEQPNPDEEYKPEVVINEKSKTEESELISKRATKTVQGSNKKSKKD